MSPASMGGTFTPNAERPPADGAGPASRGSPSGGRGGGLATSGGAGAGATTTTAPSSAEQPLARARTTTSSLENSTERRARMRAVYAAPRTDTRMLDSRIPLSMVTAVATRYIATAALILLTNATHAQQTADIGFESIGRAAPLSSAVPREYPVTDRARLELYPDNDLIVGPWRPQRPGPNGEPVQRNEGSAWDGAS